MEKKNGTGAWYFVRLHVVRHPDLIKHACTYNKEREKSDLGYLFLLPSAPEANTGGGYVIHLFLLCSSVKLIV